MNDDNAQDGNEPSPVSAGSHGKVAVSVHTDNSACAFPGSRPIRRQRLTLTDAEREAIGYFAAATGPQYLEATNHYAAALRRLLERAQ